MYEKKILKDLSCGIGVTLEIIGGKWKPCLINCIQRGIRRPTELAKHNPGASKRVLMLQLKELEEHGIVTKIIYPELPPRVEYYLTELGASLLPIISLMEKWGSDLTTTFQEQYSDKHQSNVRY
ncbi:winged helix-turn-helix transcriptional regulator [Chitinophaga sp. Hz27]|uniref:winged helix-turn-helix transcriptional regulator n=1 Tax=Chitinophaga sp. Hz27 TaxID=3347169 RepID=UPI0035D81D35